MNKRSFFGAVVAITLGLGGLFAAGTSPIWIEYVYKKGNAILCETAGGKYVLDTREEARNYSLAVVPMKCVEQ